MGFVFAARSFERFGAPRVPIDWIVGVLLEVWALLVNEAVGWHEPSLCVIVGLKIARGSACRHENAPPVPRTWIPENQLLRRDCGM